MHVAMYVTESGKILRRKFWALQSLKDLIKVGLIKSTILEFRMLEYFTESDIHHTIDRVTEFRNIVGSKGIDEFLGEIS